MLMLVYYLHLITTAVFIALSCLLSSRKNWLALGVSEESGPDAYYGLFISVIITGCLSSFNNVLPLSVRVIPMFLISASACIALYVYLAPLHFSDSRTFASHVAVYFAFAVFSPLWAYMIYASEHIGGM